MQQSANVPKRWSYVSIRAIFCFTFSIVSNRGRRSNLLCCWFAICISCFTCDSRCADLSRWLARAFPVHAIARGWEVETRDIHKISYLLWIKLMKSLACQQYQRYDAFTVLCWLRNLSQCSFMINSAHLQTEKPSLIQTQFTQHHFIQLSIQIYTCTFAMGIWPWGFVQCFLPRSRIQTSVSIKMKRQCHTVKKWEGLGEICYCCAINDNCYWRNILQDARKQLVKKVKSMSHLSAYHQVAIVTKQLCILSEFFLTLLNGIC